MDHADSLPTDLAECHRLLLAAYQQTVQLERRAAESARRATMPSSESLNSIESWTRRRLPTRNFSTSTPRCWRSWPGTGNGFAAVGAERIIEGEGQQHLFDLTVPDAADDCSPLDSQEPHREIAGHSPWSPSMRVGSIPSTSPSARAGFPGRLEHCSPIVGRPSIPNPC